MSTLHRHRENLTKLYTVVEQAGYWDSTERNPGVLAALLALATQVSSKHALSFSEGGLGGVWGEVWFRGTARDPIDGKLRDWDMEDARSGRGGGPQIKALGNHAVSASQCKPSLRNHADTTTVQKATQACMCITV
jgi:hypothetical protein